MKLEFGYGSSVQSVYVPDEDVIKVLHANPMQHERKGAEAVEYAMDHPIGSEKLEDLVRPGMQVAIVTSDISRPLPSYEVLPSVIDRLNRAGVPDSDIKVVFALGSHRTHTTEEKKKLAGEAIYSRVCCEDSSDSGFLHLGETSNKTPVDISSSVAKADFRICLGNIEFHYFAGYSGGYKAIMPGCSTYDAIQANHRKMTEEDAHAGKLEGNPVRMDIEEAGEICGVDYIVNCVLDEHKNIIYAVAGDVVKAHRAGCGYLDRMYRCDIPEKADIVIVSQGGAPKDANLYQVQKALDNAKHAVKPGGTIILAGECKEGYGSPIFEEWLKSAVSPDDLVDRIQKEFRLGGHKAAAIGMVEQIADVYLVSSFDEETVRDMFMTPFSGIEEAYAAAVKKPGTHKVIAMPFGGATLPVMTE